jgi:hypothetical protein
MLTSELKKFQAKQIVLLCPGKKDGKAVARSIVLVVQVVAVVRKRGPIKIKN